MVGEMKDRLTPRKEFKSVSQSTKNDGTSTEAAWVIAEALGVRVDRTQGIVDSYGEEHALAALFDVQAQLRAGKQLRSPIAVMIANLKSGAVQLRLAEEDPDVDFLHDRYHNQQASEIDTAAKRLARASGCKSVKCACGEEFPI